jgi:hypothetical protein
VQTPIATRSVPVSNTEQYVQKEQTTKNTASEKTSGKALKLSFN